MEINTFQQEKGLYVFRQYYQQYLTVQYFSRHSNCIFYIIMLYIMLQTESISSECFIMVLFTRVVIKSECVCQLEKACIIQELDRVDTLHHYTYHVLFEDTRTSTQNSQPINSICSNKNVNTAVVLLVLVVFAPRFTTFMEQVLFLFLVASLESIGKYIPIQRQHA